MVKGKQVDPYDCTYARVIMTPQYFPLPSHIRERVGLLINEGCLVARWSLIRWAQCEEGAQYSDPLVAGLFHAPNPLLAQGGWRPLERPSIRLFGVCSFIHPSSIVA